MSMGLKVGATILPNGHSESTRGFSTLASVWECVLCWTSSSSSSSVMFVCCSAAANVVRREASRMFQAVRASSQLSSGFVDRWNKRRTASTQLHSKLKHRLRKLSFLFTKAWALLHFTQTLGETTITKSETYDPMIYMVCTWKHKLHVHVRYVIRIVLQSWNRWFLTYQIFWNRRNFHPSILVFSILGIGTFSCSSIRIALLLAQSYARPREDNNFDCKDE